MPRGWFLAQKASTFFCFTVAVFILARFCRRTIWKRLIFHIASSVFSVGNWIFSYLLELLLCSLSSKGIPFCRVAFSISCICRASSTSSVYCSVSFSFWPKRKWNSTSNSHYITLILFIVLTLLKHSTSCLDLCSSSYSYTSAKNQIYRDYLLISGDAFSHCLLYH